MPKKRVRIPKYCFHRGSGQGYICINGGREYLGIFNSPESLEKYHKIAGELAKQIETRPRASWESVPLMEVCAEYRQHLAARQATSLRYAGAALQALVDAHGAEPADTFGPRRLKALRAAWIGEGKARETVNKYCGVIVQMFRWAASEELVGPEAWKALESVRPLQPGESQARERIKYREVTEAEFEETCQHLPPVLQAACRLLRLTGARPSEVLGLRPCDIDTSREAWIAVLVDHKTAHKGKPRILVFGPQAQAVLAPLMDREPEAYMFRPADGVEQRRNARAGGEKQAHSKSKTERRLNPHYTSAALRLAVKRATASANAARVAQGIAERITRWTPYCERHRTAQLVLERFDGDTAKALLGHSKRATTDIYTLPDVQRAIKAVMEIG